MPMIAVRQGALAYMFVYKASRRGDPGARNLRHRGFQALGWLAELARGFWSEVQRVYENRICTSLPSSLRIAWNGVLKPRHFLGVRLAVRMMSWISSSDTLSMSI